MITIVTAIRKKNGCKLLLAVLIVTIITFSHLIVKMFWYDFGITFETEWRQMETNEEAN